MTGRKPSRAQKQGNEATLNWYSLGSWAGSDYRQKFEAQDRSL
jgi:hypothetical protein